MLNMQGKELQVYVRGQMGRAERVFLILDDIQRTGGMKSSQICEKYGYSPKAVSRDLKLLKKYGHIKFSYKKRLYVPIGSPLTQVLRRAFRKIMGAAS